jgi:hypothetical protein
MGAWAGAVVSSLVPFVYAEVLLLGLTAAYPADAAWIVVLVATGQMAGKVVLFLGGGRLTPAAAAARLARWCRGRGRAAGGPLVGVSALVGLPPFYLVSLAAPALGVRLRTFLAMGLAGRLLRFGILAALPALAARLATR